MPHNKLINNGLGQQLSSHWHEPAGTARGAVIVAAAIGISQAYYQSFAAWLAEQGFLAVTFDYCGIGESLQGPLRAVKHSVTDWARHDCGAVLDEVHRHNEGKPLYWIGHSLGGQIVPFISGNEKISKLITVACGSGYWKDNAPRTRPRALLLWQVLMPILTPLYGYFPGKRLNIIGDLPPRVAQQWRTWCLNPRYAAGINAEHQAAYSRFRQPITGLAFVDDEIISAANVHTLHGAFDQAPVELHFIDPQHFGGSKVGHLGFFRRKHQQPLWDRCLLPELAC